MIPLWRVIVKSARKDLFLGIPFSIVHSATEIVLGLTAAALIQLIFVETPRVAVGKLIPEKLQSLLEFGQTLDRKDIAIMLPTIIVVVGFVKMLSNFFSNYFVERAGHRVAHTLREKLLENFLRASGNIIDSKNPDRSANDLMQDTTMLQNNISKGTIGIFRDIFVVLGILGTILFLDYKAVLVSGLFILPLVLVVKFIAKKLDGYVKESATRQNQISTRALQTRNGLLTIFGLRSQNREFFDFKSLVHSYYDFIKTSFFIRTIFKPGTELVAIVALAFMLQWRLTHFGEVDTPTYSALAILVAIAFRPIKNLGSLVAQANEMSAVYDRLNAQWLELTPPVKKLKLVSKNQLSAVEASDVSYNTLEGTSILTGCSLSVLKGQRVALVGESGAGKTTMLRLLTGLLEPSQGTISVQGEYLLATQAPYVFKGSVKDNVVYTSPKTEVSDDKVKDLLLQLRLAYSDAGCRLFVEKKVGVGGEGLSGGERARVALGRLLFASPTVLFLDEPTANLDADSSKLFWQAVDAWHKKDSEHTVIAVSHALHEISEWDQCFYFSGGKIVRSGPPKEMSV